VSCKMRSVLVEVIARFWSICSTQGTSCAVLVAILFDVLSTVLRRVKVSLASSCVWSVVAAILDATLLYASQYSGILQARQPASPFINALLTDSLLPTIKRGCSSSVRVDRMCLLLPPSYGQNK